MPPDLFLCVPVWVGHSCPTPLILVGLTDEPSLPAPAFPQTPESSSPVSPLSSPSEFAKERHTGSRGPAFQKTPSPAHSNPTHPENPEAPLPRSENRKPPSI